MSEKDLINVAMMFERLSPSVQDELLKLMRQWVDEEKINQAKSEKESAV